ncbi:MAG: ABC transporter ATP-binding protein/permease [Acidobacteriota bacterium]|nr:ABC transporter ATP-binding protein/permease [Acidobacteriota bacterium]
MKRSLALPVQLLRRHPGLLARFAAASLGRAALTGAGILLIREFLAAVLGQSAGFSGLVERYGVRLSLWSVVGLLLLALLGSALLTYSARINEQRIVAVVELGTMDRLIRHILSLSVSYFDRRTHGEIVQTVRQDVTHVRMVVLSSANILLDAMQAIALMLAAISLSARLAFWAFLLVPVAVLPIAVVARKTLVRSFGVRRKNVAVFDMLMQLLHGIRIIKIYEAEKAEADRTLDRARSYFDELVSMERVRALARVALESLAGISMVIVIIAGGFQVMAGAIGWPELLAFLMAARAVQGPLQSINQSFMEIQRHGASLASVDQLLRERADVRDLPDARPLVSAPQTISVRNLGFAFGAAPVLQDISFDVHAGETLGIVGPSGSGKTTLLNLLARFYDPTSGAVLFDGQDLRGFRLTDLHDKVAIVSQDPFLFTTSIADNIRRGKPSASDAEVEEAARAAEIHDDIVTMPQGYATLVGHGGRTLSRGEAQRVNIARAILKNAPILLLDEATSSLDSYAEARVQRAIDRLVVGRLAISVAHRLSTLRNASRILVIENGEIVGLGTHAELLQKSATYQRLWEAQAQPAPPPEASVG